MNPNNMNIGRASASQQPVQEPAKSAKKGVNIAAALTRVGSRLKATVKEAKLPSFRDLTERVDRARIALAGLAARIFSGKIGHATRPDPKAHPAETAAAQKALPSKEPTSEDTLSALKDQVRLAAQEMQKMRTASPQDKAESTLKFWKATAALQLQEMHDLAVSKTVQTGTSGAYQRANKIYDHALANIRLLRAEEKRLVLLEEKRNAVLAQSSLKSPLDEKGLKLEWELLKAKQEVLLAQSNVAQTKIAIIDSKSEKAKVAEESSKFLSFQRERASLEFPCVKAKVDYLRVKVNRLKSASKESSLEDIGRGEGKDPFALQAVLKETEVEFARAVRDVEFLRMKEAEDQKNATPQDPGKRAAYERAQGLFNVAQATYRHLRANIEHEKLDKVDADLRQNEDELEELKKTPDKLPGKTLQTVTTRLAYERRSHDVWRNYVNKMYGPKAAEKSVPTAPPQSPTESPRSSYVSAREEEEEDFVDAVGTPTDSRSASTVETPSPVTPIAATTRPESQQKPKYEYILEEFLETEKKYLEWLQRASTIINLRDGLVFKEFLKSNYPNQAEQYLAALEKMSELIKPMIALSKTVIEKLGGAIPLIKNGLTTEERKSAAIALFQQLKEQLSKAQNVDIYGDWTKAYNQLRRFQLRDFPQFTAVQGSAAQDRTGQDVLKSAPKNDIYKDFPEFKPVRGTAVQGRTGQDVLKSAVKNVTYEDFLENMDSTLITPVQRIPRYVLLVKDLKKNVEPLGLENDPSINDLAQAIEHLASGMDEIQILKISDRYLLEYAKHILQTSQKGNMSFVIIKNLFGQSSFICKHKVTPEELKKAVAEILKLVRAVATSDKSSDPQLADDVVDAVKAHPKAQEFLSDQEFDELKSLIGKQEEPKALTEDEQEKAGRFNLVKKTIQVLSNVAVLVQKADQVEHQVKKQGMNKKLFFVLQDAMVAALTLQDKATTRELISTIKSCPWALEELTKREDLFTSFQVLESSLLHDSTSTLTPEYLTYKMTKMTTQLQRVVTAFKGNLKAILQGLKNEQNPKLYITSEQKRPLFQSLFKEDCNIYVALDLIERAKQPIPQTATESERRILEKAKALSVELLGLLIRINEINILGFETKIKESSKP